MRLSRKLVECFSTVHQNKILKNDIVLLRINDPNDVLNFMTQSIPICTEAVTDRVLLGTCGMGSTDVENGGDASQHIHVSMVFFLSSFYPQKIVRLGGDNSLRPF